MIDAKKEVRKLNLDNLYKNITDRENIKDTKEMSKIYKKAAVKDLYEKLSHLTSL